MENELIISSAVSNFLMQENDSTLHFEYFSEYLEHIIKGMKSGAVITEKGQYSKSTIRQYLMLKEWWSYFETQLGKKILFNEITYKLSMLFKSFLVERNLSLNTISQVQKKQKSILSMAFKEGLSINSGSGIKITTEKTPKIYLSLDELKMIKAVELPKGQDIVRDIMFLQIFSTLRYSTLMKLLINPTAYIKDNGEGGNYIQITADKTGEEATFPIGSVIMDIFKKYNCKIPIYSQVYFNKAIKEICKKAGLKGLVATRITKGGVMVEEFKERWEQCSSHTLRRTGLTLMMLEQGINTDEILAISSHKSESALALYNRSSGAEKINRIINHKFFSMEL